MTKPYTKEQLDAVLGKLALASVHRACLLAPGEADILVSEICALRQACDCYDGSKGIALAAAAAARESQERASHGKDTFR